MRIAIVGTGYVGLVSGTCFAELGVNVTCIDRDKSKIAGLKAGKISIYEPGLDTLVHSNYERGTLKFVDSLKEGLKGAEMVFIAVGTPADADDGRADLSYVFGVADELADHLEEDAIVVVKSTVPVGTGARIRDIISAKRPDLVFDVVSNPEFLREGCAVKDFLNPDRIIVGVESERAKKMMEQLYAGMIKKNVPVLFMDVHSSELTKYACNAFLATRIGFINEIADICEKLGANVMDVTQGMGLDFRIGKHYLSPGPGFGGSCLPKDTLALRKMALDSGAPAKIVESVIHANERRKLNMAQKIIASLGETAKGKTVSVLGLAFKANTDDMRHSPSLMIIPELIKAGITVRVYDPQSMEQARQALELGSVTWCNDIYECVKGANTVAVLTEWDDFREMDLGKVRELVAEPVVVDVRNLFSRVRMKAAGFKYISLGRKTVQPEAKKSSKSAVRAAV